MEETKVMYDIESISDCKKLDKDVAYVTIDIKNVDIDVISYLVNNGNNLHFTDRIDNKCGYVYVDYATFVKGQSVVDDIINGVSKNFNELEIARYLYISLGKTVGYDINITKNKDEFFSFNNINCVSSIWSGLASGKITDITLVKAYLYLCSIFEIECDIIVNNEGRLLNKIIIDSKSYIVDLSSDMFLIQAGFKTNSFNNIIEVDKKIGYIKRDYNDVLIDKTLKPINLMDENIVYEILLRTQKILNVSKIKSFELGKIYKYIFNKYYSNYDVVINNLFINNIEHTHFILISHGNKHYSYNYDIKSFMMIDNDSLISNLDDKRIGLYYDEIIPDLGKNSVVRV